MHKTPSALKIIRHESRSIDRTHNLTGYKIIRINSISIYGRFFFFASVFVTKSKTNHVRSQFVAKIFFFFCSELIFKSKQFSYTHRNCTKLMSLPRIERELWSVIRWFDAVQLFLLSYA